MFNTLFRRPSARTDNRSDDYPQSIYTRTPRIADAGIHSAACGTAGASTGPVTLTFYLYPDNSGATQQAIKNCDAQSHGKYTISYQLLPQASDGQRQQLVRRLAAHDNTIDIMGLDVTWESEFAQAGWIQQWTGANKAAAANGTQLPGLFTRARQPPNLHPAGA